MIRFIRPPLPRPSVSEGRWERVRERGFQIILTILCFACLSAYPLAKPPVPAEVKPYAHAQDFSWISGQLKFDPSTGWNVVYAAQVNPELAEFGTDDALERVRLYDPGMKFDSLHFKVPNGIKAGDLVIVQGTLAHVTEIIQGERAGRTMYEVKSIKKQE